MDRYGLKMIKSLFVYHFYIPFIFFSLFSGHPLSIPFHSLSFLFSFFSVMIV